MSSKQDFQIMMNSHSKKNVQKIVLMEKSGRDTQRIQFVNKVALATGDSEEFRGFENSTPTSFKRVNRVNSLYPNGTIFFGGNIFKEHPCEHDEIRVFCNTGDEYGDGVSDTPAMVKALESAGIKVYRGKA